MNPKQMFINMQKQISILYYLIFRGTRIYTDQFGYYVKISCSAAHKLFTCSKDSINLQDVGIETWCSKVAKRFLKFGSPLFHALEKGLKSNSRSTSRDCLAATAWIGSEIMKAPDDLRYAACEILLSRIEQFVHPGLELEERLLGCLCIYYYTSGRGITLKLCSYTFILNWNI